MQQRGKTMSFLDDLGDLAKKVASGTASDADVHAAYDQVATSVPTGALATGLTHTFNSDQTPPFETMVSGLFNQSNPDQKAGILNKILSALGTGGVAQAVGSSANTAVLAGGSVTPQQAQQISPETVQVLAQNAAKKDPSIVDAAAGFYAAHPTLIKAIGAGALALLMSKISQNRN
jgi:hypothetical protein